jgi:DNA-binding NarL/FixJ family response regulator
VLGLDPLLEISGIASDVASAEALLHERPDIDVVLLDVHLPGIDGIEGIARMRQIIPDLKVVVFTGHPDNILLQRALAAGATGYISKESALDEVAEALRSPMRTGMFLSAREIERLAAVPPTPSQESPKAPDTQGLTRRELEILAMLASGTSVATIANEQFVSIHTLRDHVKSIYRKLGAHSQLEAVALARSHRLVP